MSTQKPGRRYAGSLVSAHLRSELDRLVQEVLAARESSGRGGWTPPVDVLDGGDRLVVLLEVAGLAASDLHVESEGNVLRVRGRRRLRFPTSGVRFHCLERQEGNFERQLELAVPVDFRRAAVTLAGGLLRIELPKIDERRRRVHVLPISELAEEPALEP
jgi:HSP20 family protein